MNQRLIANERVELIQTWTVSASIQIDGISYVRVIFPQLVEETVNILVVAWQDAFTETDADLLIKIH